MTQTTTQARGPARNGTDQARLKKIMEAEWACANGHTNGFLSVEGTFNPKAVCPICQEYMGPKELLQILEFRGMPTEWIQKVQADYRAVEEIYKSLGGTPRMLRQEEFETPEQAYHGGYLKGVAQAWAEFDHEMVELSHVPDEED